MTQSAIEWTEHTWNPVRGCTKVSPGCAHCYAETFAERFRGVKGHPYEQGFDLRLAPEKLSDPLRRRKPTIYFVNSMSDLFQDGVPDDYIDRVFAVMALAKQHTFQILTKRAERMRDYCSRLPNRGCNQFVSFKGYGSTSVLWGHSDLQPWPLPNVWLGVSVENQHFADARIPLLLQTPAAIHFVSAEPLLSEINFRWAKWQPLSGERGGNPNGTNHLDGLRRLDWVIVGGESGPGARPMDLAWARSIVQQCQAAGVACFVKQLGARPKGAVEYTGTPFDGDGCGETMTEPIRLRDKKGGDLTEFPADLQVREFPMRAEGVPHP